jgi:hypothetical protein
MEKEFPKRSPAQNRAVHKWFELIGEEWNGAGYEQKLTFGTIDTPWTKESVKIMFKKIAFAMYDKKHTSDLTTKELTEVSEVLNRGLAEQGLHIPFPSLSELMYNDNYDEHKEEL